MIKYETGNIFDSNADALVNTVNTVGVMGKGIALQFKRAFPNNFKAYKDQCDNGEMKVGQVFVFKETNIDIGEKIIINFPTKQHWRKPSEYVYIEKGLDDLVKVIKDHDIKSIAIPPLGAGNGGLVWERVKRILHNKLQELDIDITIYEPNYSVKEVLKKERVKLTKARSLLLYVLFDLVKNGEYVSEFSSEKVAYFLQKFGAKKYFKLDFQPNFYGPYSGKVRFVLNALNGSYLMGFSDMDKKPFDPLTLISESYKDVVSSVENDKELYDIAIRTTEFLDGFYSEFALELLSSLDYIATKECSLDKEILTNHLSKWNDRKRSMITNSRYIDIAVDHLRSYN
ncbi:O-acetyl-ADP-ribose deacetylase (regulator of RNase III) [Neolewinella xylanilytica]|uniref:O-acetyl-ADP-ribose deacetylase (Regulator of RNase III) n=1 Tax=Neolewinella xylanilytica TaxID=1514080 RepID=A0A2S6IAG2_9BACT|nr:macro domain-containing protein [Neolewinella xylanilytica]PPK88490.1 O-acetyl-ADP-ribose deacetylase (regulator of RNase III) [Neolewinella xylanilytica]